MTDHDDSGLDLQATSLLREAYRSTPPAHLGAGIDQTIHARLTAPAPPPRHLRLPLPRRVGVRIGAVATAAALVAGGLLLQLHGAGVTPVSAQTVINRAAAAGPVAGQVQHSTYQLTTSDGYTGTADLWFGNQASQDCPVALTESLSRNGVDTPALDLRFVMNGGESRTYDPATNTIIVGSPDMTTYSGLRLLMDVFAGRKFGFALQAGATTPSASQLTHGTFNGVGVYSVSMGAMGTLDFNDQSYRLEGLTWTVGSQRWEARVLSETDLPLASAPSGTFDLNAPASAQTVVSKGGVKAPENGDGSNAGTIARGSDAAPVDLVAALVTVCQTTPEAVKSDLGAAPSATPLQVCQHTRPATTADQLASELLSQIKTQLDAAVASGSISRSEADAAYADLQQTLPAQVTAPIEGPGTK
jgi:hypothetical protein